MSQGDLTAKAAYGADLIGTATIMGLSVRRSNAREEAMDVTTAMRRAAVFFANREAVVHGNDRFTFAQAWERGCRLANGLIGLGLKPGDRVAVLEGNSKEAADFFLGAGIANLVRVPLYPRNSADAHLHMVEHTGCRAVIARDDQGPAAGMLDHVQMCVHAIARIE